jgi:hypothetical protein
VPSQEPTGRPKPSDACCPTCASSTGTSAALLRSATERFAVFMIEEIMETIYSCGRCKTKPILLILFNGLQNQAYEAGITRKAHIFAYISKVPARAGSMQSAPKMWNAVSPAASK